MRTRVKICCIANIEEASLAIAHGADALGLVGPMPSGPGIISDATAAEVARMAPPPISTFLLTSETDAASIARHALLVGATTIQVVNHIDPAEAAKLAELIPNTRRVQVVHVEGGEALALIDEYEQHAHAFLLDSGRPSANTPELGGTGRVHDWDVSRRFVDRSPLPVFLAGGLTPVNVAEAIRHVRPFGLDLCSGVRTEGALDLAKLNAFMTAVRAEDARRLHA